MQLAELMKEWPCTIYGSVRTEIQRVQHVVQAIQPGDAYLARKGKKFNGEEAISQAIALGAAAIVVESEQLAAKWQKQIPVVWVPNILSFTSYSYAKMAGFPSEALTVIGVTGTNGKTTVTHFIAQILHTLKQQVIVVGTNGAFLNGEKLEQFTSGLTTWEPHTLQDIFLFALKKHVPYVVLEASSMGLATHRLDHIHMKVAVYLNISTDHIEDHGSFSKYKEAKRRLADLADYVIINADDPICRTMHATLKKPKWYFGMMNRAQIECQCISMQQGISYCLMQHGPEHYVISVPLVGEFQLQNLLAAITTAKTLGFPFEDICQAAQHIYLPQGRMQYIKNDLGLSIVVDYAHTTAAMEQLLKTLRQLRKGKLIVVFSCGGERDVDKRQQMGEIADKYADYIILTSDNARSEDPHRINEYIRSGFRVETQFEEVIERAEAIYAALNYASIGDTVAIVGKGHEQVQITQGQTLPFSDIDTIEQYLRTTFNNKK